MKSGLLIFDDSSRSLTEKVALAAVIYRRKSPGGLTSLTMTMYTWIRQRPRLKRCETCGARVWFIGFKDEITYCSARCCDTANCDYEIPF